MVSKRGERPRHGDERRRAGKQYLLGLSAQHLGGARAEKPGSRRLLAAWPSARIRSSSRLYGGIIILSTIEIK